ncbi:macro domain-containing protein [Paenibacillus septentrionalis]|uniref:Macro domain-containing protein n=1 Tax=Paenibacillus septentrionalis TaxID=429342 RepID=A0ABW1V4G5_9BACL
MIKYTSGDLLQSSTEALVNTVNCEGFMGKGIAYQFKLEYPSNNTRYIEACKTGELQIGKVHYTLEKGKVIINFPTKDKWRAKSKLEYIEKGLDALIVLIQQLELKSISIPPLGSGNGGLLWSDVKKIIEKKLDKVSKYTDIYIYEASSSHGIRHKTEPVLNVSALILMEIKSNLERFNSTFLYNAALIVDILSTNKSFINNDESDAPISKTLNDLSKKIREFQVYHNVTTTEQAKSILYNKIISENTKSRLNEIMPSILRVCEVINTVKSGSELNCLLTLVTIIDNNQMLTEEEIVNKVTDHARYYGNSLTREEILTGLDKLIKYDIIEMELIGYSLKRA